MWNNKNNLGHKTRKDTVKIPQNHGTAVHDMEVKSGLLEEGMEYDWKQQRCGFYGMQWFILCTTREGAAR
jgi:hypothetical protein